jgi:predicted pyridoxine 5'-phosphate oxidase superfamily flavin-nucleotide-binding protein
MSLPIVQPNEKFKTVDNFVKWFDERTFGTEKGSLGLERGTTGKIIQYEDFSKLAGGLQSKQP